LYLEPFVRAFLLGVGSGVLFETAHVSLEFLGLVNSTGAADLAIDAIENQPSLMENLFAPLFYYDQVAAILGWMCFYVIDVVAIAAVLDLYKDDAAEAGRALNNLVTLPKKMLPLRLAIFKKLTSGNSPSQEVSAAALAEECTTSDCPVAPPDPAPITAHGGFDPGVILPPTSTRGSSRAPGLANIIPTASYPPHVSTPPEVQRRTQERTGLRPGQLSNESQAFLRRAKELSDRRSYLHGFWYAAALADNVKPGRPFGVDILGRRVVLFRDSTTGVVQCIDDTCPHRGAPLSSGWMDKVEGHDCVVCPYHGWALDAEGRLRDVPAAETKGEWPHRPIVPAHSVEERGGFIWLFYGPKDLPADARPPIPYVPELEDPKWKAVYGEIEFDCNHHAVFENAIDMAHIHYLHSDSFGNQGKPEIRDMTATVDAFSVTASFKLHNKPVSALWEWSKVPVVEVTAKAYLPSTSMIAFTLANGLSFTTFVNTVPIDAHKTINRFALVRNLAWDKTGAFNADAWDRWARKAMMRILGEDKDMVERLRPDLLGQEFSVRADLPQVAFRKLRQQYIDLGYGRAPERASPFQGVELRPDF